MIKVIIEREVKKGKDIAPLLRELRVAAMHQPGYVTGETLVSAEDKNKIVAVSTWLSPEQWQAWETSETRAKLYRRIEPLLTEKPEVRVFEIWATETGTVPTG